MRIYDGVAERWQELRLERVVVQRWKPLVVDCAVELSSVQEYSNDEPCFQARWLVGDCVIAGGAWRPLRSMADRDLLAVPRPSEHKCPGCDARQMYQLTDYAGYVCAACGEACSHMALHRKPKAAPKYDFVQTLATQLQAEWDATKYDFVQTLRAQLQAEWDATKAGDYVRMPWGQRVKRIA